MDINDEMLIHEVSKRRSLWDQTSSDYMNRSLKLNEWITVAQEMNSTVEEVKKRWKYLKDTFNRELHTLARTNNTTNWVHYEQMSFLLKGLNNLLLPSAFLSRFEINYTANEINFSENHTPTPEDMNYIPEYKNYTPEDDCSSRKKMKSYSKSNNSSGVFSSTSSFQSTPLSEREEPTEEFATEDYYFLMSLLPSFDKMTAQQKMKVKIKIMQIVFAAAFGDSINDLNGSS